MLPTETQIERTILAVRQRLAEPLMNQRPNQLYRQGYEEVARLLEHRITDPAQISPLEGEWSQLLALFGISYLLGRCSQSTLLLVSAEQAATVPTERATNRGRQIYEAIQQVRLLVLADSYISKFAQSLQDACEQYGISNTYLMLNEVTTRYEQPEVTFPSYQLSQN